MAIINYSLLNEKQILELIPNELQYDKLIVFPDICKVTWLLPTGVVILTNDKNWRKFAISDIGCGMLLCKSSLSKKDFNPKLWDNLYTELKYIKDIGDFSKGNHFLNAIVSNKDNKISFLIHSGIEKNIDKLISLLNSPSDFDIEYNSLISQAKSARFKIFEILQKKFGELELIIDKDHNHFEKTNQGIIIRRGAVKIVQNEYSIIPSHLLGHTALIKAKSNVVESLFSICHGTGRLILREENSMLEKDTSIISNIFKDIYIPSMIKIEKLYYDTPQNYRNLEDCLPQIQSLVEIHDIYSNIAYIGKL